MTDPHAKEIRFWFRVAGAVLVIAAAASFFSGFFRAQAHGATGRAEWIWPETKLSAGRPLAFFAVKEFDVPADPPFVRIKIACDPEYALYFNGHAVGRAVAGASSTLDVYDVTPLARAGGRNRIVVAARSPNGVGGLIAAVDYAPIRENDVVTDSSWTLVSTWDDALPVRDVPLPALPMRVLGRPPYGRWNDLMPVNRERVEISATRLDPVAHEPVSVPVARVRVLGGVAVESTEPEPATAWDFGQFEGRCLLRERSADTGTTRLLRFRYEANLRDFGLGGAIREVALAPGETSYLDPGVVNGRWVAVFDSAAEPRIVPLRDAPEK